MTLLGVLFISPFCALTSALFSARTVHHIALTTAVAPLLAIAASAHVHTLRGGAALWTSLYAVTFWFWHIPTFYAWALSNHGAYWLMQTSLLLTALGFWLNVLRASPPVALAALLATMVQMGMLGALLTFGQTSLYTPHFLSSLAWGLNPLEDQQLAGLIMWAPGAGLYLAAALAVLARWFERERRSAQPT
jgi:putative membrane protein